MNRKLTVMLVFVAGLVIGGGTAAWAAQAQRAGALPVEGRMPTSVTTDTAGNIVRYAGTEPVTLTNESIGLRVTGRHQGRVIGTLVARVDGQWVEVQFGPQDQLLRR